MALLLGAQDEDARMVGATVLVYQQYPRERKMAVLLAASVKFNKEFYRLQEVSENSLKLALSQAPEEMYGVRKPFRRCGTCWKCLLNSCAELSSKVKPWRPKQAGNSLG